MGVGRHEPGSGSPFHQRDRVVGAYEVACDGDRRIRREDRRPVLVAAYREMRAVGPHLMSFVDDPGVSGLRVDPVKLSNEFSREAGRVAARVDGVGMQFDD